MLLPFFFPTGLRVPAMEILMGSPEDVVDVNVNDVIVINRPYDKLL